MSFLENNETFSEYFFAVNGGEHRKLDTTGGTSGGNNGADILYNNSQFSFEVHNQLMNYYKTICALFQSYGHRLPVKPLQLIVE